MSGFSMTLDILSLSSGVYLLYFINILNLHKQSYSGHCLITALWYLL